MTTQTSALRGALLAIVATATLTGCSADPGASPTADASPSGTASPLGTSPSTGLAAPGEVTIDPSLPDALPLPDDIWEKTGPGWVLVNYRPTPIGPRDNPNPQIIGNARQVIYLISPTGTRYQIAELDPDRRIYLESWSAGETVAYVRDCSESASYYCAGSPAVLNLDTGELGPTPLPVEAGDSRVVTTYPGGIRVWNPSEGGGPYLDNSGNFTALGDDWSIADWHLIGSGTWLPLVASPSDQTVTEASSVVRLVSLATGESVVTPGLDLGWACGSATQTDARHVDYYCENWTGGSAAWGRYVFDIQTGETLQTATGTIEEGGGEPSGEAPYPRVSHSIRVGPDVWAGLYDEGPASSGASSNVPYPLGIDDHGVLTPVVLTDDAGRATGNVKVVAAVGTTVYVTSTRENENSAPMLFSYDLATGTQRLLVPTPPAWPTLNVDPVAEGLTLAGMVSWVVAP